MRTLMCLSAGMVAVAGLAVTLEASASAASGPARVIHGGQAETLPPTVREQRVRSRDTGAHVVHRQVTQEAATVSRALAEQPVHPHLAELRVGNQQVMVDPQQTYRQHNRGLDRNHSIVRAQDLYRQHHAQPARVIRNEHAPGSTRDATAEPVIILHAPYYAPLQPREPMDADEPLDDPALPEVDDRWDGRSIPSVPEHAEPQRKPLVRMLDALKT